MPANALAEIFLNSESDRKFFFSSGSLRAKFAAICPGSEPCSFFTCYIFKLSWQGQPCQRSELEL